MSTTPTDRFIHESYATNLVYDGHVYRENVDMIKKTYDNFLDELDQRCSFPPNLSVLEIGSGLSWVCGAAKRRFPSCFTVAQDLTDEVMKECNQADKYYVGKLENLLPQISKHKPFSLISMTHVFEHVIYPKAVLATCADLLSKKGMIFITAPYRPPRWTNDSPISD